MERIRSRCLCALVAMLLVGGCSSGGGATSDPTGPNPENPGTPAAPPQTAQVTMVSGSDGYGGESHSFQPTRVEIARNGTVTWVNSSGVVHNVTFSTAGAPAGIGDHASGSHARSFPVAGTFDYSCTNHAGMTGQVVVR